MNYRVQSSMITGLGRGTKRVQDRTVEVQYKSYSSTRTAVALLIASTCASLTLVVLHCLKKLISVFAVLLADLVALPYLFEVGVHGFGSLLRPESQTFVMK